MPIRFAGRGILLDIEGTVAPIALVYDVLFPYARQHLDAFLIRHWNDRRVREIGAAVVAEAAAARLAATDHEASLTSQSVALAARHLMDADAKTTALKTLQGLIWQDGFHSGALRATLFDDVRPALDRFARAGLDVRIYSSGSILAQQQFFGHTTNGDLRPLLHGYFDTTTGPKRDESSYARISREFQLEPREILFLSDVVHELRAACQAGMQTALVIRPGNPPAEAHDFDAIESLADVIVTPDSG